MKLFTFLRIALLLVADVAANCNEVALSNIPSCSQKCFSDGASLMGCGAHDHMCQCAQEPSMYAAVEDCVAQSCRDDEYQKVIDGFSTVCNCANTLAFFLQQSGQADGSAQLGRRAQQSVLPNSIAPTGTAMMVPVPTVISYDTPAPYVPPAPVSDNGVAKSDVDNAAAKIMSGASTRTVVEGTLGCMMMLAAAVMLA